ncbi:hypothetical protein D3C87_1636660 [compost metagenome]
MRIAKIVAAIVVSGQKRVLRMFNPVHPIFAGGMHDRFHREDIFIMGGVPGMPGITHFDNGARTQKQLRIVHIINVRNDFRLVLIVIQVCAGEQVNRMYAYITAPPHVIQVKNIKKAIRVNWHGIAHKRTLHPWENGVNLGNTFILLCFFRQR